MERFKSPIFTTIDMETILALAISTLNLRPLALIKGFILSPLSWGQHDFTVSAYVSSENTNALVKESYISTDNTISDKKF